MIRTQLYRQLTQLFERELSIEVPGGETDLLGAGLLDSLSFVELLLQLEQEFGLHISLDNLEVDNFRSIAAIADFILARSEVA